MESWFAQCVETWQINKRGNLYLLDAISPGALTSMLPSARTRTVARIFVHLHNLRVQRVELSAHSLRRVMVKFT
jgi:hypothetical protein